MREGQNLLSAAGRLRGRSLLDHGLHLHERGPSFQFFFEDGTE